MTENDVTDISSHEQADFVFNDAQSDVGNSVDTLPPCDSEVVNDLDHNDIREPASHDVEPLRRSSRIRRPVERYGNPVYY